MVNYFYPTTIIKGSLGPCKMQSCDRLICIVSTILRLKFLHSQYRYFYDIFHLFSSFSAHYQEKLANAPVIWIFITLIYIFYHFFLNGPHSILSTIMPSNPHFLQSHSAPHAPRAFVVVPAITRPALSVDLVLTPSLYLSISTFQAPKMKPTQKGDRYSITYHRQISSLCLSSEAQVRPKIAEALEPWQVIINNISKKRACWHTRSAFHTVILYTINCYLNRVFINRHKKEAPEGSEAHILFN